VQLIRCVFSLNRLKDKQNYGLPQLSYDHILRQGCR